MANWPSISNPGYPLKEEIYKPQIRQEFEANYVQSRPRSTRALMRFQMTWENMTEADWQTLSAFFRTTQGNFFTWVHPVSGVSYTCRFTSDTLESDLKENDRRKVTTQIEEV
jgi:hypothetical protein